MASFTDYQEKSPHPIDQLEQAFKNCIEQLSTQEHFNSTDSEENKVGIEQSVQKFIDLARQTESFFLNKRLILSAQRPEQVLKEDILELKNELDRKEKLIEKHHERLQQWQNLLHKMPGNGGPQSTGQNHPPPPSTQQGAPSSHPGMMHATQQPPPQMNQFTVPGPPPPSSQSFVMPPPHQQPSTSYPLTYLKQNLSNIGMPERR